MDEGSQWGWTGDWGFFCGMPWFPSGYEVRTASPLNANPLGQILTSILDEK